MYKIISPNKVTEKAWGLNFIEGEAKTENDYLALKLKKKGYEVEVMKEAAKQQEQDPNELNTPEEETPEEETPENADETDKLEVEEPEQKKQTRQKKSE